MSWKGLSWMEIPKNSTRGRYFAIEVESRANEVQFLQSRVFEHISPDEHETRRGFLKSDLAVFFGDGRLDGREAQPLAGSWNMQRILRFMVH